MHLTLKKKKKDKNIFYYSFCQTESHDHPMCVFCLLFCILRVAFGWLSGDHGLMFGFPFGNLDNVLDLWIF